MKTYIKKLKCLGDETRIRILKVLLESQQKLCVCEIVDSLQIPFYTISKHIKELKNAELVTESKDGKFVLYTLTSSLGDKFMQVIVQLIRSIPNAFFKNDIKLLDKRLSLRNNGKCIIGMEERRRSQRRLK